MTWLTDRFTSSSQSDTSNEQNQISKIWLILLTHLKQQKWVTFWYFSVICLQDLLQPLQLTILWGFTQPVTDQDLKDGKLEILLEICEVHVDVVSLKKSFCACSCGLYVVVRRGTIHVRFYTFQFHQYIHREAWSGHSAEVTFITAVGTPPHWDPQLIHLGEVHRTQDCCRRVSEKMFTCVHRRWLVGCSIWIGAQGFYLQMFTDLADSKTKRKLHFISSWDCSVWI